MSLTLQRDETHDCVVATRKTHGVCELEQAAPGCVELDWSRHVPVDPALVSRKAELHDLVGDPSRAARELGWEPAILADS